MWQALSPAFGLTCSRRRLHAVFKEQFLLLTRSKFFGQCSTSDFLAWGKINPKLQSLAEEDYSKRETDLFGPVIASR